MADNLPKLARTVAVGGTFYRENDTPPVEHAKKITNPKNWQGNSVPDFDNYLVDDDEVSVGVRNSSAANAGRTGLPGVRPPVETGSEGAGTDDDGDDADAAKKAAPRKAAKATVQQ